MDSAMPANGPVLCLSELTPQTKLEIETLFRQPEAIAFVEEHGSSTDEAILSAIAEAETTASLVYLACPVPADRLVLSSLSWTHTTRGTSHCLLELSQHASSPLVPSIINILPHSSASIGRWLGACSGIQRASRLLSNSLRRGTQTVR